MPIYEYRCEECGKQFELFVRSLSQEITPVCPKCGAQNVARSVSLFGVGGASQGGRDAAAAAAACGPGPV